jgi:hypothetical protein
MLGGTSMKPNIFLCHTAVDKPFVRRLAAGLEAHGVRYWLDEAEIKVGDSLIEKIREGLDEVDYVAVVLSPDSVESRWVKRELDVALNQEISGRTVRVLPIMHRNCEPPSFLLGKFYADFRDEAQYAEAFRKLVESIGVVFNSRCLDPQRGGSNLGDAIDKAALRNLPLLGKPFHRPFQYLGLNAAAVSEDIGVPQNRAGSIIVDTDECHMLLEVEGSLISFIEVDLKGTAPCSQAQEFDPEPMLGALSINPRELDLVRSKAHCHTYYDHRKSLKINVMCVYDGGPISVSFSSKYYGL